MFYTLLINFTFFLGAKILKKLCQFNQMASVSIEIINCRDTNDSSLCFDVIDISKGLKSFWVISLAENKSLGNGTSANGL